MKVSLILLALLGAVWSARSLADGSDPWESANRHATFYDDGSPRTCAALVDGRLEGPARTWHRDGSRASEGDYADGLREGVWRFWHPGGALDERRSGLYAADVRVAPLPD